MLSKQAAIVGSVMDKVLHANGDKWVAIVIVMVIHVCVGRDVRIGLQLTKEKQLTFDLGEKLAPKMHWHGGGASAEYADHVVLEHLDGLLGEVAAMIIRGDKFVCHLGEFSFGFVCKQCLVVEYLVSWDDAALGHLHNARRQARMSLPLLLFLSALLQEELESTWCKIMM